MGAWEQGNSARYVLKSILKPVMKTERKILGSQKIQQQEPLKLACSQAHTQLLYWKAEWEPGNEAT